MGGSLYMAAGTVVRSDERESRWFAGALLVLLPLMVLAPNSLLALAGVVLAGSWLAVRPAVRPNLQAGSLDSLLMMGIAFSAAVALSIVVRPGGLDALDALLRVLLVPIGFAAVRGSRHHDLGGSIWLGAATGAIGAGALAVGLVAFSDVSRPTSFVNAIHFGELALLLGFVATVTRGLTPWNRRIVGRVTLVAIGAALAAAVLSQARGSWLALPAIALVVAVDHLRGGRQRRLRYAAVLFALLVPVSLVAATANNNAAFRALDRGVGQTVQYVVSKGGADTGETSVGARLEMWRSAFAGFRSAPFVGVGWGNIDQRFAADVDAGVRADRIAEHEHPHNQYLSHLASGGLIGLASLLALFAIPARIFVRAWRSRRADLRALGAAGLGVVVGYALFSITDSVFESAAPLLFFVITVGLLAAQIVRVESEQMFAYRRPHGVEQPERLVGRDRTHPL